MRVGKKNFPYPVLNRDQSYSTINESFFRINENYEIIYENGLMKIKNIKYELDDSGIQKLIDDKLIKIFLVIESSSSFFKKTFELTNESKNFEVSIDDLKDRVEFSSYGVVVDNIPNYKLNNFNEFYQGFNFSLAKNNIILIDDGFSVNIEIDESDDDIVSSIFLFIRDDINKEIISVNHDNQKINIHIPEEQFQIYELTKRLDQMSYVYFSNLLIPALLQTLTEIKFIISEDPNYEDISDICRDYYWFSSISKQYKNVYEEELTIDILHNINILELSQKLINNPVTKSIDRIYELTKGGDDIDEDTY